jgi:hypothetical protein
MELMVVGTVRDLQLGVFNLMGCVCSKIKGKKTWFLYCVCVARRDKAGVFYSLDFMYACNDGERRKR